MPCRRSPVRHPAFRLCEGRQKGYLTCPCRNPRSAGRHRQTHLPRTKGAWAAEAEWEPATIMARAGRRRKGTAAAQRVAAAAAAAAAESNHCWMAATRVPSGSWDRLPFRTIALRRQSEKTTQGKAAAGGCPGLGVAYPRCKEGWGRFHPLADCRESKPWFRTWIARRDKPRKGAGCMVVFGRSLGASISTSILII